MPRTVLVGAIVAASVALSASAQPIPKLVTHPDWVRKPTAEDMAEEYPAIAQLLEVEGRAILDCRVEKGGGLTGCHPSSENPVDLGFGAAALRLSELFQMRPMIVNGVPVDGGFVRIPIAFRLPTATHDAPPPAPRSPTAAALGRRVVEAYGLVKSYIDAAEEQARKLEFINDQAPEADRFALADALRIVARAHEAEFRSAYASAMASVYSDAELASLADYMESPAGRAARREAGTLAAVARKLEAERYRRQRADAHDAFCRNHDCDDATAKTRVHGVLNAAFGHVDSPIWSLEPSDYELSGMAPPVAAMLGLTGIARANCIATADGLLQDCVVAETWPSGFGFEDAARKAAARYRLDVRQLTPGASGQSVTLRVTFPPYETNEPYEIPPAPAATLALARELRKRGAGEEEARVATGLQRARENFRAQKPASADAALYDAGIEAVLAAAAAASAAFEDQWAATLASAYSEAELRGLIAYRNSPLSETVRTKGPAIGRAIAAARSEAHAHLTADLRERYCNARHCKPAAFDAVGTTRGP